MDYREEITRALDKDVENIAFLAYFPKEKLQNKLTAIRKQLQVAEQNNLSEATELLKLWEQQVVDALVIKEDLQISDNPKLDMPLYLPEIEVYEMLEKRQALLKQRLQKDPLVKANSNTQDLF